MEFERKLTNSADSTVLRGKLFFAAGAAITPSAALVLHPSNLGVRAAALATIFSRFRFKDVHIKFQALVATAVATGVVGILDDASNTEGDAPTTVSSILELRSSASVLGQTIPQEFVWSQLDRTMWYACSGGSSVQDPRFLFPGVIYIGSTSASSPNIVMEIDYTIVFKGASDIGTN